MCMHGREYSAHDSKHPGRVRGRGQDVYHNAARVAHRHPPTRVWSTTRGCVTLQPQIYVWWTMRGVCNNTTSHLCLIDTEHWEISHFLVWVSSRFLRYSCAKWVKKCTLCHISMMISVRYNEVECIGTRMFWGPTARHCVILCTQVQTEDVAAFSHTLGGLMVDAGHFDDAIVCYQASLKVCYVGEVMFKKRT